MVWTHTKIHEHTNTHTRHSRSRCNLPGLLIKQIYLASMLDEEPDCLIQPASFPAFQTYTHTHRHTQGNLQMCPAIWRFALLLLFIVHFQPGSKMSVQQRQNIYRVIFCYTARNNAVSPLGGFCCKCSEWYDAVLRLRSCMRRRAKKYKSVESDGNDASDGDKNYELLQ